MQVYKTIKSYAAQPKHPHGPVITGRSEFCIILNGYIIMATAIITEEDQLEFQQVMQYLDLQKDCQGFVLVKTTDVEAMITDNLGKAIPGHMVVLKKNKKI